MAFFRIFAWILVALALMLIGADGISTLEAGEPVVRTTQEIMAIFGLDVMAPDEGAMADVAKFFLELPLWAILGVLGALLTLIFRPID